MNRARPSILTLLVALSGCTGTLDAGPAAGRAGRSVDPREPVVCASEPGRVRARRLTAAEHAASVADVLGVSVPAGSLPADEVSAGFAANAETAISETELRAHLTLAESIARETVASGRVAACADQGCMDRFLDTTARRLHRRTLETAERDSLSARATEWRATEGDERAMEMVLATLLVSPRFLYVVELSNGAPREDGAVQLDGPSLASRLSFLLAGRGPDLALLEAAEAGELDTPEGLAREASRLATEAGSVDATASFLAEWLRVSRVHAEPKATHPSGAPWTAEVAASMERDSRLVLAEIVETDGGLGELLSTRTAFLDATLAPLHGVDAPATGETVRVELASRHGVLSHAAVLSGLSHASAPSWTLRGRFIREQLLCETMPPPPVGTDLTSVPQGGRVTHPVCGSCHARMEPIGQGMDGFDAWGLPRAETVETPGELVSDDPELAGEFTSVEELSERLAHASAVRSCVARHAFRFAHRRLEGASESCAVERIARTWDAQGGDFRALLVAVATDESFRWARPEIE